MDSKPIGPLSTITRGLRVTRREQDDPFQRYSSCGSRLSRLCVVTQTAEMENGASSLG